MTTDFNFVLLNNSSNSFLSSTDSESSFISNDSDALNSLLTVSNDSDDGFDAFGSKDIFGSFDPSNMNSNFFVSSEGFDTASCGSESSDSVAYGAETAGSIACGAETAGSVACASDAGSSCDSGSFCSVC